jgi:hypothetical protein
VSTQNIQELAAALERADAVTASTQLYELANAVLIGSGDSLASARIANRFGHRAMSSGDLAWSEQLPAACDVVVGISHSGTSGATVRALRAAHSAGLRTIAITSQRESPLAEAADDVQLVPALDVQEEVPCAGHVMLGLGVAAICGVDVTTANQQLLEAIPRIAALVQLAAKALPARPPQSASILSLPDLRSAGDFWSLKLIEATGLAARNVPLEESGHVDYFIGPQNHLTLQLVGNTGQARFDRLAEALLSTGQTVQRIAVHDIATTGPAGEVITDIGAAILGTYVAHAAAAKWGRAPFRGGEVNMDASHIKLEA